MAGMVAAMADVDAALADLDMNDVDEIRTVSQPAAAAASSNVALQQVPLAAAVVVAVIPEPAVVIAAVAVETPATSSVTAEDLAQLAADDGLARMAVPSREEVCKFLQRVNPVAYGAMGEGIRYTDEQKADLDEGVQGLLLLMVATAERSPSGLLLVSDCPLLYADEDPRNVWALEGRFRQSRRTIELPLIGVHAAVDQRWRREVSVARSGEAEEAALEGHSTTGVCWDGAVVLADLLCLHPAVLASHSPNLARSPEAYRGWSWGARRHGLNPATPPLGCHTTPCSPTLLCSAVLCCALLCSAVLCWLCLPPCRFALACISLTLGS